MNPRIPEGIAWKLQPAERGAIRIEIDELVEKVYEDIEAIEEMIKRILFGGYGPSCGMSGC